MLGEKVGNLMIYVKQEELGNYEKIKQLVLKQFQPTPRVLLSQFRSSQKLPNENYVQFASRIEAMFHYYCKLRNVNELCQLIVADQIINSLDQKLTSYINIKITQRIIPEKRRRYDFDQSRRVLLSSDLHSISVLMAQMETDPPDITNSCEERNRLSLEIEALDIVINRCTELVNFPDTDDEGHSSGQY
ncbi:integrase catalytic domain-containing protein [Trichonephila clavipes]|nr:integrase catalytic domain-containing protein [Trichonephila clavipes]